MSSAMQMKETYEGADASNMTSYQPLIKNLHSLSLKNRNLRKDFKRTILPPGTEKYKLWTLFPGTTKSPRLPMHVAINSYVASPRSLSTESLNYDYNSKLVSFIDANKEERVKETAVREFIVKNVLNGENTSTIKGLTTAKDFQKNKRKGRKAPTLNSAMGSDATLPPDRVKLEAFDD